MVRLLKSQVDALPFRFEEAVKEHITALEAHRFAETGVAAPIHHHLVDAAIRRVQYPIEDRRPDDFIEDYEIIDDTPPLWERKKRLVAWVERSEEELAEKIWPTPLRRLEVIECHDLQNCSGIISDEDQRRLEAIVSKQKQLDALRRKTAHVMATIDVLDENNIGSWTFDLEI